MNQIVPMNAVPAMTVSDVERVALAIARGGLFGSQDPNAVLTLCLLAQAEGQHPAVVFRDYHIIKGKPAKKAEAMLRDFITAGGKIEWHSLTDTCADATFSHPQGGTVRISWDHERAKKAKIVNEMYQKYPRQMLRSRVISEGVRSVYPGATSGLYEEGEVASFDPPHDAVTGEIIEVKKDPPVPGITKIKNNLNKFMREGNKATDLETFRALVKANKDDLKTIREANHSYWTGDGEDHEGFSKWMERRYADLTPKQETTAFQFLASVVSECPTIADLQSILDEYSGQVEELDGEESRRFEALYNEREEVLKAPTPLTAGAYGA